jgi:putative photosynthetic complex assembly protein
MIGTDTVVNGNVQPERFPRAPLLGAATLVGFALLAVGTARLMHWNATPLPAAQVVQVLHLSFHDRGDGAVEVLDGARHNALVQVLAPGTDNFIRGILRAVGRGRHVAGVGGEAPLSLTRWSDGRLTLDDPQTGEHLNLEVFGTTNAQSFAKLFAAAAAAQSQN